MKIPPCDTAWWCLNLAAGQKQIPNINHMLEQKDTFTLTHSSLLLPSPRLESPGRIEVPDRK